MAVAFDEMNGSDGDLRQAYKELSLWLQETPPDALEFRRKEAELLFRRRRADECQRNWQARVYGRGKRENKK